MLASASYDSETKTLSVTFQPKKEQTVSDTFYYSQVPLSIFEELVKAESAGKYFLANVKGKFEGRKVEPRVTYEMPQEAAPDFPGILPDPNSERPY